MRDTWLVFRHAVDPTLRSPIGLGLGLAQPILYLVLFGPLLAGLPLPDTPAGSAWQVFLPGLLVMLAMFTAGFAGFALIPDQRSGVLERMRVSPLSRSSLLLGRVLRDVVVVLVQTVALIALAVVLFGLQVSAAAVIGAMVLVGLLSTALASASYSLALKLRNEYEFAPVIQNLAMPLLLLSGFLIPMDAGPEWLRVLSRVNPMTYVMDAERGLFLGDYLSPTVLVGGAVALVLAALFLFVGIRAFHRVLASR